MLLERIQDIRHFLIIFHTPVSISAPHIYISTGPFLPSQSPLSRTFSREFTSAIKVRVGNLSSWPAPPLEWTGHAGWILSVGYSPNGTRVVTGSTDKTIRIWDAESGAAVGEHLTGHNGDVNSVAYSPDGQRIISGSSDYTIRIWDAETGTSVGDPLKGHTSYVWSVAYSPDGRRIISGSDDCTIRIWDVRLASRRSSQGASRVWSIAYSPDGRRSGSQGMPRLALRSVILSRGTLTVRSVAYSPDGRRIISGSSDRTIRIWDAETGAEVGDPLKGTLAKCGPLLTLLMGGASSPDPTTAPFESGMPRLALRSAILSRGTLTGCGPSFTLLMGGASSPDPTTAPFESGMPRLVLRSAILSRDTLARCGRCLLS
jgi:WD40 repeat protein